MRKTFVYRGTPIEIEITPLPSGGSRAVIDGRVVDFMTGVLPDGGVAAFLTTGYWTEKTWDEVKFYSGNCYEAWDGRAEKHAHCPDDAEIRWKDAPVYVHMCTNNTIYGTCLLYTSDAADE